MLFFKIFKNIHDAGDDYRENAAKSEFKNIQKIFTKLSPDDYEKYIGTYNYYGVDDSGAPFDMSQDVLNKHIIATGLILPVEGPTIS